MTERSTSMTARTDQALIGVLIQEDGEELVRYVADEADLENDNSYGTVDRALALAGAWSDLDAEEMLDALDRIRHESTPTPPIEDL